MAVAGLSVTMPAACDSGTGQVAVTAPHPRGRAAADCRALVAAAPDRVAGQSRRSVSPASPYVAAWGDPPVVLRCGVAAPSALRPSSQCFVVNGVGWLVTQQGREVDPAQRLEGTLEFTTIGRSAYVDVSVPGDYQPAADALVDLARAVRGHTALQRACR